MNPTENLTRAQEATRRRKHLPAQLQLWQTEWCPSSRRVRQRLTELGLSFTAHQVPVERGARAGLYAATGQHGIPALVVDGEIAAGENAICTYLERHFTEPSEAPAQREKARGIKRKELEEGCQELTAVTH
ncbi:MAG: glutaredoxin family protein [Solirubrobacteraceae bacterium]